MPELAVINVPFGIEMDQIQNFVAATDANQVLALWTSMFLKEEIAEALLKVEDKNAAIAFLRKGVGQAPTWTPTKCAVQIQEMTGIAMAAETSWSTPPLGYMLWHCYWRWTPSR